MEKLKMVQKVREKWKKAIENGITAQFDYQATDIESFIDSSLTLNENVEIIEREFKVNLMPKREHERDIEGQIEKARQEHLQEVRQAEAEALQQLAKSGQVIDKYYGHARHFVRMVKVGITKGLVFASNEGGIGKTWLVDKVLADEGLVLGRDYESLNTFSTPLELYNFLYANSDKIIVLDDVEGLMSDGKIIGMLKAATWSTTGKRILHYNTTSAKREAPDAFEFTGKIILMANDIPQGNAVKALISRTLFYEMGFTFEEKCAIMREIAANSPYFEIEARERQEICNYITSVCTPATRDFTLRTLIKAYDFYRYDKDGWKELFGKLMQTDEDKAAMLEVQAETPIVKEQIRKWCEKTGKSRRAFFYVKKQLKSAKVQCEGRCQ